MNVHPHFPFRVKNIQLLILFPPFFLFTIFHPLCRHLPVLPDEKRTEIADDFTEIFDKGAISTSKRLLYSDAKCSPK